MNSARHFGQQSKPPAATYIPVRRGWDYPSLRRFMTIVVRTRGEPLAAVPDLRSLLKQQDPDLPVERISTMDMIIGDSLQATRFNTVLLGLFAGVALLLSAVGIYGVVVWNVTQRTREIGVRLALGADRSGVLWLVVGQSMRAVLAGVVLGVAGSLALVHLMQNLIYGIGPFDPVTFAVVIILLTAIALLACWLPARRATKVDPMVALRTD